MMLPVMLVSALSWEERAKTLAGVGLGKVVAARKAGGAFARGKVVVRCSSVLCACSAGSTVAESCAEVDCVDCAAGAGAGAGCTPKVAASSAKIVAIKDLSMRTAANARAVLYSIRDVEQFFFGVWGYCDQSSRGYCKK